MSSARRPSSIQEIQKRQRLQPVPGWVRQWVKPQNSLPGSTYKVLKWVKTEQKQYFSDDEEDAAEAGAIAVVDEEVDDSRMASELPGDGAANDDEGDEDDADDTAAANGAQVVPTDEAIAQLKSMDNLTKVADQLQNPETKSPPLAAPSSSSAFPVPPPDTPIASSGLEDITKEEIDALLPSGPVDMPEPAPDGPTLGEITQEQLMEDSSVFDAAPSSIIAPDGIIESDNGMEFVIGEP